MLLNFKHLRKRDQETTDFLLSVVIKILIGERELQDISNSILQLICITLQ